MGSDKNIVLSVIRGLAIILVVYGHVIQRSMAPFGEDFFMNPAFKLIYAFHMPLFVFLSGWSLVYSLSRRDPQGAFRARCRTLLIPFISWGILGALSLYAVDLIDGKALGLSNLFMDLARELVVSPTIWILVVLFVSSGLLLLSIKLEKQLGIASFLLIYFLVLLIPYNEYFSHFYIKWLYLFYAAGYFVSKSGIQIKRPMVRWAVLIGSLVIFVQLLSYWVKTDYIYINRMHFVLKDYSADIFRILYRWAIAFSGIAIVFCIGNYLSRTRLKGMLDEIGIYSLDIYLIQRYIIEGFYPRLVSGMKIRFDFNGLFFLYVFAPLVTFLAVGLCLFISKRLIRKNPLLNKILLGGRA